MQKIQQEKKECRYPVNIYSKEARAIYGKSVSRCAMPMLTIGCSKVFCSACWSKRMGVFGYRAKEALPMAGKRISMLTLTMQGRVGIRKVKERRDRINRCFSNLTKRKFWIDDVSGGARRLEVTGSEEEGYHLHLHVLMCSNYIDREIIVKAWKKLTKGSYMVDIREVKTEEGINYLRKGLEDKIGYLSKGACGIEVAKELKGTRWFSFFGKEIREYLKEIKEKEKEYAVEKYGKFEKKAEEYLDTPFCMYEEFRISQERKAIEEGA